MRSGRWGQAHMLKWKYQQRKRQEKEKKQQQNRCRRNPLSTKTFQEKIKKKPAPKRRATRRKRGLSVGVITAIIIGVAILVLGVIYFLNNTSSSNSLAGQYPFQVGQPGPGMQAPAI